MSVATDTWLIFRRSMKQSLRNPFWVVIGIVQPFLYLALFGPLLIPIVQSTPGFPPGDAWQVLVPALLIQLGLFGGLFVGFSILTEFKAGVVERMQVTPVSRVALLLGRALKETAVLLTQGVLLTVMAIPFGLRAPIGGVVVGLALVAVLGFAASCASYALALRVKSEDAFVPIVQSVFLPLLLLSGILLPMTIAPAWLFALSRANPFVYVVDATRAVFVGDLFTATALVGIVVAVVLAAAALFWGVRTFQRESA
ncbi:ABC transporter permease [Pseudonocardia petroleophila]|uniref:Transport permease protein n=1 Tax=Pseudonocardia petroleophila TaxID=37331 RepID=A0A7G7MKC4_9PSEU|nr:ABC transporter permease [Pseudonocardia petroleophila]QNG53235.1 ABC transporter permease [Pseudonocardia petroleophila]